MLLLRGKPWEPKPVSTGMNLSLPLGGLRTRAGPILPCPTEQTRNAGQPHLSRSGDYGRPAITLTSRAKICLNIAEEISGRVFL